MKLRAIIFDEVEALRDLLQIALSERGYEVLSFADPSVCPLYTREADSCPQQFPCCDLLITDKHLAKMSGLELIRRQQAGGCKGMPENMAVMSDSWTPEELEQARQLRCHVFRKPFRLKDVAQWLDERSRAIDRERQLAELH